MGKLAGLQIEVVKGYAKGVSYRVGSTFSDTNHAWNAIKIGENGSFLMQHGQLDMAWG